jgi:single-stranded-DNA-specific exonuclease
MKWLEALEPFGKDFPSFQFLFEKVKVTNVRELRGGHLKLTMLQGAKTVDAMIFSPSEKYKNIQAGVYIDILGEPKWNYFNGSRTLQIFVKDFREG